MTSVSLNSGLPAHGIAPSAEFRPLLESLNPSDQEMLRKKIGEQHFLELKTLSKETDPELYWEALLHFGQRLQRSGHLEGAIWIYGAIAAPPHPRPSPQGEREKVNDPARTYEESALSPTGRGIKGEGAIAGQVVPAHLQHQAQLELEAIQGQGDVGRRLEFLGGQVIKDSLSYKMVIPFSLGAGAYQLGRTAALSRYAVSAGRAWYERGLGARFAAAFHGIKWEAPMFGLSSHFLRDIGGEVVSWDPWEVGKVVLGAGIMLSTVKGAGFGGEQAFLKIHRLNELGAATRLAEFQKFSHAMIPQVTMFGGMLASHGIETKLKLREPAIDGATFFTDALVSQLSMVIGGNVAHRIPGESWYRYQVGLGIQANIFTKVMEQRSRPTLHPNFGLVPVGASVAGGPSLQNVHFAVSFGEGGGKLPKKTLAISQGALAQGGESALRWLLAIRQAIENGEAPKGFSSKPTLIWIPETPLDAILLNDFSVAVRPYRREVMVVNGPGRIPIKALPPILPSDEAYLYPQGVRKNLGEVLERWNRREDSNLQELFSWDWLLKQLNNLFHRKEGVKGTEEKKGKRYLLFKDGKREYLPTNFGLYPERPNQFPHATLDAFQYFQSQYWGHHPLNMEKLAGSALEKLPKDVIVSILFTAQGIPIGPFARPLVEKKNSRIFFQQGVQAKHWVGRPTSEGVPDVTKEFSQELYAWLGRISEFHEPLPKPQDATESDPPTPSGERPGSDSGVPKELPRENVDRFDSRPTATKPSTGTAPFGTPIPKPPKGKDRRIETDPTVPLSQEQLRGILEEEKLKNDLEEGKVAFANTSPLKSLDGTLIEPPPLSKSDLISMKRFIRDEALSDMARLRAMEALQSKGELKLDQGLRDTLQQWGTQPNLEVQWRSFLLLSLEKGEEATDVLREIFISNLNFLNQGIVGEFRPTENEIFTRLDMVRIMRNRFNLRMFREHAESGSWGRRLLLWAVPLPLQSKRSLLQGMVGAMGEKIDDATTMVRTYVDSNYLIEGFSPTFPPTPTSLNVDWILNTQTGEIFKINVAPELREYFKELEGALAYPVMEKTKK